MVKEQVTIVVPVYNREKLIVRCLDSIKSQSWRPLRVIVVDNDSTDSTAERVREWILANADSDFRAEILTERKSGASAARNRGLERVESEYTIFFDSDDEMLPGLIESAVSGIGDSDLVYWRGRVINLDGSQIQKPFYRGDLLRRHFYNCLLSTQLYMARTRLFREVGGWNEEAAVWNDWELGVRISLSNPKYESIDKELTLIHAQRESITGTAFSARIGEWEHTLDIVDEDIEQSGRKELHRLTAYRRAILSAIYKREGAREAGCKLMKTALRGLGFFSRLLLRILSYYTEKGGRGAYYFWR